MKYVSQYKMYYSLLHAVKKSVTIVFIHLSVLRFSQEVNGRNRTVYFAAEVKYRNPPVRLSREHKAYTWSSLPNVSHVLKDSVYDAIKTFEAVETILKPFLIRQSGTQVEK